MDIFSSLLFIIALFFQVWRSNSESDETIRLLESYNEALYVFKTKNRATGRSKMERSIIRNSEEKVTFYPILENGRHIACSVR